MHKRSKREKERAGEKEGSSRAESAMGKVQLRRAKTRDFSLYVLQLLLTVLNLAHLLDLTHFKS